MDIKQTFVPLSRSAQPLVLTPAPASAALPPQTVSAPSRPVPDQDTLAQAINSINNALKDRSPGLEFSVDDDSQRTVVKIVDRDTQEVIRQLPSQEALDMAKALATLTSLLGKQSA